MKRKILILVLLIFCNVRVVNALEESNISITDEMIVDTINSDDYLSNSTEEIQENTIEKITEKQEQSVSKDTIIYLIFVGIFVICSILVLLIRAKEQRIAKRMR